MSLRSTPLDELAIPDGTTVEEHDVVTDGDVVVGGRATVDFGLRGRNVLAGEGVTIGGDVEAEGDCRLDMWSEVRGNVLVGRDAYLGDRVGIDGELKVAGDLDIGDDVDIDEGFEANGWIVIRNPMPTIVFLFVYLSHVVQVSDEAAAQELLDQLTEQEPDDVDPLAIPRGARVGDEVWEVSTPARIGDDCRLHGNVRAESIVLGQDCDVFGSLRATGDVSVGPGTTVHGDVTTHRGTVTVAESARVRGDVTCSDLEVSREATVDGTMRASGTVSMEPEPTTPSPAE